MISWHKKGQKVECIDDQPYGVPPFVMKIKKGQIYTIDEVIPDCFNRLGFLLEELEFKNNLGYETYLVKRFRPVYPTAIEKMKKLLIVPNKTRELQDA